MLKWTQIKHNKKTGKRSNDMGQELWKKGKRARFIV
jgi:hypothetical protein